MGENFGMGYAMGRDNSYGNGCGFGGDWLAILVILALCGNGGFGFGGGYGGGGNLGYELGRVATTNDVASGFNNSAVLSNLNDLKLGQQTGFAAVQQTLCQGFNGVDRSIGDCCCRTQQAIADVKYAAERNTYDIIQAQERGTQRIIDWLNCKETQDLREQVLTYKFRESQSAQNAYLLDQIVPRARPAYAACNPNTGAFGFNGWNGNGNGCNGCGGYN